MIVDLATFNINTDQLFQKLTQTRAEIERLKAQQKDLQKEFTNSNKSVNDNQKKLNDLNTELQGLTRGTATYNETLARRDIAERELNASLLQQAEINARYQTQLTQNRLELNQLSNQARSYETVLNTQNRATNESIDLYTRQRAELSLLQREQREMGATLIQMERNGESNTQAFRELTTAYNGASERANELAESLREVDTAGGNFTSNIGNYQSALEDFKTALFAGDTQGLRTSFDQITGSIKGMITQSLAFIATPIGAAITALAGIGLAAKAVFDFNEGVKESNTLLKGLGVASGDISRVRSELEATAETFGKSFDEIAKTADSLATSYGISISEANDIIAKGLVQGGTANEDFLNQISEYDVQFKQLGFTAEESLAAINAGFAEGVYNDKLPDALKELGLSLTEGTKATRDALVNAFGQTFTDDLLKGVNTGAISVKDALQKIDKESQKVGLSLQQQQQLTADVFRGAGEDAGGALKIIEILNKAQNRGYTESEKAINDLRLANERLNKVQAGLFEIEDFGTVWANIKTQAINFFVDAIEYINELKQYLQPLIDLIGIGLANSWQVIKTNVGIVFDFVGGTLKNIGIAISGLVDFVKKVFSGDFKGAINVVGETFFKLFINVQNTFNKIRNTIIDGIKGILSNLKPILEAVGIDTDKLTKKLEGLKGKVIENKSIQSLESKGSASVEKDKAEAEAEKLKAEAEAKAKADKLKADQDKKNADANKKRLADAQKAKEEAQKKLDDAIKAELESAQKLADEKVKFANVELNAYIEKNKSILDNEKYLTAELVKQEQERLRNLEKAKLEQEKLEFDTANKIFNEKIKSFGDESKLNQTQANELATLKLQQKELELQYNSDVTKIKEDTQKGITETETRYSKERIEAEKVRKAIQYQTEILDLEAKGATEAEIKTAQLEQQKEIEVTKLIETSDAKIQAGVEKRLEEDALLTEEQALKSELEAELALAKDENEKIRLQNQLDALKNIKVEYANKDLQIENAVNQNKLKGRTQVLTGIAQLFGAESDMGKALAIANIAQEKATAISSIISATGAANAKAVAASPLTAGMPWVGINTARAGLEIGVLVAQGASSIAQITGSKFAPNLAGLATSIQGVQTLSGFAGGGYTGDGGKYTPAGIVHKGEVVFSQEDVKALGGAMAVDAMRPTSGLRGYANGGIVGLQSIQNQIKTQGIDTELLANAIGEQVMRGAMAGTEIGSNNGIGNYNDNSIIRAGANF